MSQEVTASINTLFDQTSATADTYFNDAIRNIDGRFGEGYAKENPSLVGDFMKVCERDFNSGILHIKLQEIRDALISMSITIEEK
jgi:hypothetical protein